MGMRKQKIVEVPMEIVDATAVPEDVRKGKVFYNNLGRQEGILEDIYEIGTFTADNTIISSNYKSKHGNVHTHEIGRSQESDKIVNIYSNDDYLISTNIKVELQALFIQEITLKGLGYSIPLNYSLGANYDLNIKIFKFNTGVGNLYITNTAYNKTFTLFYNYYDAGEPFILSYVGKGV